MPSSRWRLDVPKWAATAPTSAKAAGPIAAPSASCPAGAEGSMWHMAGWQSSSTTARETRWARPMRCLRASDGGASPSGPRRAPPWGHSDGRGSLQSIAGSWGLRTTVRWSPHGVAAGDETDAHSTRPWFCWRARPFGPPTERNATYTATSCATHHSHCHAAGSAAKCTAHASDRQCARADGQAHDGGLSLHGDDTATRSCSASHAVRSRNANPEQPGGSLHVQPATVPACDPGERRSGGLRGGLRGGCRGCRSW